MKATQFIATGVLMASTTTPAISQCPVFVDTIEQHARNRYQDGFVIMHAGQPVNQFSDVHGRTKHGQWFFFRSNGNVRSSGHFEFGVKQGWWNYYDTKGRLSTREYFKHGQRLCIVAVKSGRRREYSYKERSVGGFKISDSQFW